MVETPPSYKVIKFIKCEWVNEDLQHPSYLLCGLRILVSALIYQANRQLIQMDHKIFAHGHCIDKLRNAK
jgi:hypothetical protein